MILDRDNNVRTKILNAIMDDPEIIVLLKEKYVDDEVWKYCIEREPSIFKKMKHPSEDVCMYACEVDGSNLKYIKNKFSYIKITDIMVTTSVRSNPKAILSVPNKFLTYELEETAFDGDPSLMAYFDFIRPEYVEKIISEKPYALQYVKYVDESLLLNALKEKPFICTYIKNWTPRLINALKEFHPDYYALYKNNLDVCK